MRRRLIEFAPPRQLQRWGANLSMKRKWKPLIVVVVGLGIWGLSEIFPAWEYLDGNTSATRSAGYHFYKSPEEMKKLFNRRDGDYPLAIHVHRDYFQSLAQRTILAWLTVLGFILSFGRGPLLLRVLLWIFVVFGGAPALLLLWRVLS